jgi:replication factor A1
MTADSDSDEIKITDLEPKMSHIDITFKVIDKSEARTVSSRHSNDSHRVADATVGDETGTVLVPLWDDAIENMKIGKTYELRNGFTGLFRNSLRLKVGRKSEVKEIDNGIDSVNENINMSLTNQKRRSYEHTHRPYDYRIDGGVRNYNN